MISGAKIDIRTAIESDEPALRTIWKACFGDPDAYIDFYFTRHYRPDQTMVLTVDGHPVSMLRLFDAWYTVGGLPLAAEYIFAAATHPAYQGNGYMGMLVGAACAAGAARGAVLSVLVPQNKSLFHYYENLSYHTGFYLRTEQYQPQAGERYPIEQCGFTDFCRLREQMLLQYPKRIEPGSDLWIYSYEDMAGDIYRVAIADEERYLVVRKEQDCLLVRETDCTPQELRILDETLRYTFDVTLIRLFTMGGQEDQPFGMYRILAPGCHDLPQGDAYMNLMLDK